MAEHAEPPRQPSQHQAIMKKRLLSAFLFIVYGAILIKVMVFKDVPTIRVGHLMLNFGGTNPGHQANFLPFATIGPYLLGYKGWLIAGINLAGNIALLVPLGFLLPFVYPTITWKKNLLLAVATGLVIETLQTVLHVGIFDIDDVILNALGVMLGYWAFVVLAEWVRARKYKTIGIAATTGAAASAAAFYALFLTGPPPRLPDRPANEPDLCGGTGGTGEIVGIGRHTITIKRHDGVVQAITLTDQTDIRTSAGPAAESDLKVGDHVTLVVYDMETASTVLVCNGAAVVRSPGAQ